MLRLSECRAQLIDDLEYQEPSNINRIDDEHRIDRPQEIHIDVELLKDVTGGNEDATKEAILD